jgi:serine/threonine-protein kinase
MDRLEELYALALSVRPANRESWLDENCGDDSELRARLKARLAGRDYDATIPTNPPESRISPYEPTQHEEDERQLSRLTAVLADRYAIGRQIGSGGMATVYLAEDLKHRRKVAVKVLRPELAAVLGTERFLKEIEVTANLQHPNILPLFDSGTADSFPYYVMPFIEGETLEARLAREKQLPIDEAVSIAVAMCKALEYAHQHKVVHRDIKPANILLQAGEPVVADFGIALAVSAAGGQRLTQTGLSIGTPEYMSPEQAAGSGTVDARSDLYAVACVLYEMLVGEPPHTGPTVPAIIAKVMTEPPRRIRAARETVPPHIEAVVHRALSKLPADRYPDVAQFAEVLVNPSTARHWLGFVQLTGFSWRRPAFRAAFFLLAVAAIFGWTRGTPAGPGTTMRFDFAYPTGEYFSAVRHALAISRDGSTIAYAGQDGGGERLFLRSINQLGGRPIPGTEGVLDPFFAPDGESVGFVTTVGLRRLPITGGAPVSIAEFPEPNGPSWGSDDMILFGSTSGLWQVPASGGTPEQLTTLDSADGELMHGRPQQLPGGDAVLFTITSGGLEEIQVAVLSLGSGRITRLFPGIAPRYTTNGHIVYGRTDGMLMGVPFDASRLEVTGPADTLLSGVTVKQGGSMDFAVSNNGSLIYLSGAAVNGRMALVDRTGSAEYVTDPAVFNAPSFSADGRRIIVGRGMPPTRQIWILELANRALTPATFEGHNYYPVWSPDGSRFAFTTERASGSTDLRWKTPDGTGEAQMLLQGDPGGLDYPESWSPDGMHLVFRRQTHVDGETDRNLWVVRADGSEPPRQLFDMPSSLEDAARISPDGNWLAFSSTLTGRYEVYVTRFPTPGRRFPVSLDGGTEPAWSPDGSEIFYRNGDDMIAAAVETTDEFRVLDRQVLFTGRYMRWPNHTNYDIHPDGQRFVLVAQWGTGVSQRVVVVVNWFEEMRRLMRGSS